MREKKEYFKRKTLTALVEIGLLVCSIFGIGGVILIKVKRKPDDSPAFLA